MFHTKKHLMVGLVAILAVTSGSALAQAEHGFDYSYVEAQFLHTNFDTDEFTVTGAGTTGVFTDATSNGFGFEAAVGSHMIGETFAVYGIADYMAFETDLGVAMTGVVSGNGMAPVEFSELRLGAGMAYEVDPRAALFFEAGYLRTEAEFSGVNGLPGGTIGLQGLDLSGSGLDLRAGVRVMPVGNVELFGYVRHNPNGEVVNAGPASLEYDSELRYTFGGRYRFTDYVSAGAEYEFGEPGTARLSLRYSF
ncbi:MAG: hypothetical protein EP345_18440 [Sphingomonadales bacterium]|nr:MAG: hypothetical protein EP345_18440 [Sphingomonadales bacterium]